MAQLSFGELLRLFVGLKVNKVWPHAAIIIIYGWHEGQRRWSSGD